MRKLKFKDLRAHSQAVTNNIDNNGFLETMKKLIKMYTNSAVLSKAAPKNIILDLIWKYTLENIKE